MVDKDIGSSQLTHQYSFTLGFPTAETEAMIECLYKDGYLFPVIDSLGRKRDPPSRYYS
jgi:hypothetical protein